MFGIFNRDPIKKLQKQHKKLLEEAMALQRRGNIKAYAIKTEAAEKVALEIEKLKEQKG